jgi:crotonobetainyl-CoA:carnitine CoA-transferase CaiB-like acyl-CoA transferase
MNVKNDGTPAPDMRSGALQGIKVIDLTRAIAGPFCGLLLGDLGADVVKVETSPAGERSRKLEPSAGGQSLYSYAVNRNKRGIVIDLRTAAGKVVLHELVATADVVVENFRPGVMEKMGCGWDVLSSINPRLVMARISGFGSNGPYASRPGLDMIGQAMGGIMHLTGDPDGPPTMAGVYMCDYTTGIYAALAIVSALFARHATGRGQVVEANLVDTTLPMLHGAIADLLLNGRSATRMGNRDRHTSPANTFRTGDGQWVMMLAGNQQIWERFANLIGRKELIEDNRYRTPPMRNARVDEVEALAADWIGCRTLDEVVESMAAAGIPCAKCATIEDIVNDPHLTARGRIVHVEQPTGISVPVAASAMTLSATPTTIRRGMPNPGQHTSEILTEWLAYDAGRIGELEAGKIVFQGSGSMQS